MITMLLAVLAAAMVVGSVAAWLWPRSALRPDLPPLAPLVPLDDPAEGLFTDREGERPTEDEIARMRLGGIRGAPHLNGAPMVPQEKENTPAPIDPGHNT